MATTSSEKPLELSVRNFGPIAEADIELRPMTVFVGPSNTGKSYLATLIYALHQFYSAGSLPMRGMPHDDLVSSRKPPVMAPLANLIVSAEEIHDLYAWANAERSKGSPASYFGPLILESKLPESIAELVRRVLGGDEQSGKALDDELERCFGIAGLGSLIRLSSRDTTTFSVRSAALSSLDQEDWLVYQVEIAHRGINLRTRVPKEIPVADGSGEHPFRIILSLEDTEDMRPIFARLQLGALAGAVLSRGVGPLSQPAYYLPADRAGAVRSHSALTGTLISRASRPLVTGPQPTFAGAYGDFLETLVAMGGLPPESADGVGIQADNMERQVLKGEIRIDSNLAGYPSFFYRPDGWEHDLPLMNASSMVSELAPAVLYLRHVVQPGETLIIEEPESALHPAMQVEFTRLLAAAVKAGVRIIITTHSEWVLEELANLVLMSELPVEQRHGFEGADLALSPDEVGAWLFEPDAEIGGTVVKEMPLDKEMGNFPSGFGLVTTDLYNRYTRIANRIEMLTEE